MKNYSLGIRSLEMGPTRCSKTYDTNRPVTQRNIPKVRRPQTHHWESLKTQIKTPDFGLQPSVFSNLWIPPPPPTLATRPIHSILWQNWLDWFWGLFGSRLSDRSGKTGNDGAVVCCLVESSKERKLESLKTYTFFFFGRPWGGRKLYFILCHTCQRSGLHQDLATQQCGSSDALVPDLHVMWHWRPHSWAPLVNI
jgi:hypothetical protein